mmetsp:Transcript_25072/g.37502  ORF Transcript_25072/g.37502 Transcript_25072/m.37502 type:complete len:242 (-) Transcript_25072:107-832(-)
MSRLIDIYHKILQTNISMTYTGHLLHKLETPEHLYHPKSRIVLAEAFIPFQHTKQLPMIAKWHDAVEIPIIKQQIFLLQDQMTFICFRKQGYVLHGSHLFDRVFILSTLSIASNASPDHLLNRTFLAWIRQFPLRINFWCCDASSQCQCFSYSTVNAGGECVLQPVRLVGIELWLHGRIPKHFFRCCRPTCHLQWFIRMMTLILCRCRCLLLLVYCIICIHAIRYIKICKCIGIVHWSACT